MSPFRDAGKRLFCAIRPESGHRASTIDSRYRSKKPLIVTTNLTLDELNNAPDTARQRIYDRVLELCTPIFSGENFRRAEAKEKMRHFKDLRKERSVDDRKESE